MTPLVIGPRTKKELRFVSDLLRKLGISSRTLSREETEDLGIALLMKQADRRKKVSRTAVMRRLTGNGGLIPCQVP
jgi:hypothetical protein